MTIDQYLAKRRYWEFALIMLIVLVSFVSNLGIELIERGRQAADFDVREPFVLEATSHVAMALSIPLLLWFDHWWPVRAAKWFRSAATHLGLSVVFSLAHVTMMYWARVYLYRFVIRRLPGEAGFLTEAKDEVTVSGMSDRFLVKKLGREFLVRINEIDWIESCGNYVNLHVGSRVYPLRETMTRIDERMLLYRSAGVFGRNCGSV